MAPGLELLQQQGGPKISYAAERLLIAICGQESNLEHRYQKSRTPGAAGPARGWAQFEKNGGVMGVMTHPASRDLAAACCKELEVEFRKESIWRALEGNDALAIIFARLLLWTDPKPLPEDVVSAWNYYKRNWRPGKPHPEFWRGHWQVACAEVPLPAFPDGVIVASVKTG